MLNHTLSGSVQICPHLTEPRSRTQSEEPNNNGEDKGENGAANDENGLQFKPESVFAQKSGRDNERGCRKNHDAIGDSGSKRTFMNNESEH